MNTMSTQTAPLNSDEYHINYYGTKLVIRNMPKVLALSTGGGGYTYDDGYFGSERYQLYIPNKADFGKTLIPVGWGETSYGHITESRFELNGTVHQIPGVAIDGLFSKIFKNN